MPHNCRFCNRKIVCLCDDNDLNVCECERLTVTENKKRFMYYFCEPRIFPSCYFGFLMAKYDVSFLKLMQIYKKI